MDINKILNFSREREDDMEAIYGCGIEDCKYNQDGECTADDVKIHYIGTYIGFTYPICDTYEEKE